MDERTQTLEEVLEMLAANQAWARDCAEGVRAKLGDRPPNRYEARQLGSYEGEVLALGVAIRNVREKLGRPCLV